MSGKLLPPIVWVVGLLATAGCAQQGGEQTDAVAGSNRPSASASAEDATETPAAEESPEPSEEPQDTGPLSFGETFTYENNISVTVSPPTTFTPSESAAFEESAAYLAFDVTVVNNSSEPYDPVVFNATVQSGNQEADQVYDSAQGFDGSPSTAVLPSRETQFKIGFGVSDPADIVMELTPGFEHESIFYTTS